MSSGLTLPPLNKGEVNKFSLFFKLDPNSDVLYIKDLSGSDCFIPKPARPGNSSNRLYSFPYLGSVLPSKLLPILVNCL